MTTRVFTQDAKPDDAAKGKGKGKSSNKGNAGNARDSSVDRRRRGGGKSGAKPGAKSRPKITAAPKAPAAPTTAPAKALWPRPNAPAPAMAPTTVPGADSIGPQLPPDEEGRIRHPFGVTGGKYTKADNPGNFLGMFCPTCGIAFEYSEIKHRMCVVCDRQILEALHSARMRKLGPRP